MKQNGMSGLLELNLSTFVNLQSRRLSPGTQACDSFWCAKNGVFSEPGCVRNTVMS